MIYLLPQRQPNLCDALPDNWQDIVGFASDCSPEFTSCGFCPSITVCGPCSSTFAVAWSLLAKNRLPVWGSVLALQQWQGRGQRGRKWDSPPGNIYVSLRLPTPSKQWDKILSLLCGYCLVQALSNMGFSTALKWPNDILLTGRKVAGLLLEERAGNILLGVGLNVFSAPAPSSLRTESTILPTFLNQQSQKTFFALPLWSTLVSSFYFCYQNILLTLTPSVFLTHLQATLAFLREIVTISSSGDQVTGFFSGLTPEGGVSLTVGEKTRVFFSGSLLPAI